MSITNRNRRAAIVLRLAGVVAALALYATSCARREVLPRETAASADSIAAVTALRQLVERHYVDFERGALDAWGSTMSADAVVITADPFEMTAGRDSIVELLSRDFDPAFDQGLLLNLRSTALAIGLDPQAGGAWVTDRIAYGFKFLGDSAEYTIRFSAVAEKRDTGWVFVTLHYSRPASLEEGGRQTPNGSHVPNDAGSALAPAAGPLATRLDQAFANPAVWTELVSRRADVTAFGPDHADTATGHGATAALLERVASRVKIRNVRAALAAGDSLCWIAAVLEPSPVVNPPVWRRGTFAFLRERGDWRLVHAHVSIGVRDPE